MSSTYPIVEYALKNKDENVYCTKDEKNFIRLIELIDKCKSGFARSLSTRNKDLLTWINSSLPQLQDECYQISTKCYWILNGLVDFPQCKHCGKPLVGKNAKLTTGYKEYCSISCEVKGTKVLKNAVNRRWKIFKRSTVSFKKRPCENNDYKRLMYQLLSYMSKHQQLKWLVDNRNDSCLKILTSQKFKVLLQFIYDNTKFLDKHNPSLSARVFCIYSSISNINDNRLRCKTCGKLMLDKQCSLNNGFQTYCSTSCVANNESLMMQKKCTCNKRYGTSAWNTRIVDISSLTVEQKANRDDVWNRHVYTMEKTHGIKDYGHSHIHNEKLKYAFSFNIYIIIMQNNN